MRAHDLELANEVLEPTFEFMRSQTDKVRLALNELGEYLRYREKDVGKAYVWSQLCLKFECCFIFLPPIDSNDRMNPTASCQR